MLAIPPSEQAAGRTIDVRIATGGRSYRGDTFL